MAEISADIGHDDEGKPALVLTRKIEPEGRRCFIKLDDAWMFSEDHNPDFERHIEMVTVAAYEHLIGPGAIMVSSHKAKAQRMAEIASLIENKIDDLLNCPPETEDRGRVVQDATFRIGEDEMQVGVTDKGYINAQN